jgi:hypothetical protein
MPTLTYEQASRASLALNTLAAERQIVSPRTIVRISEIRGLVRRALQPFEEAREALIEQHGQLGDVKCPHCRGALWKSEQKTVQPSSPGWKPFLDAMRELNKEIALEAPKTIRYGELVRWVVVDGQRQRDEDGVALTERIPLTPDEVEALGELLELDEDLIDEEEDVQPAKPERKRPAAAVR